VRRRCSVAIGANLCVTRSRTARRLLEGARFGKRRANSNRYATQRLPSSPINLTGNAHAVLLKNSARLRPQERNGDFSLMRSPFGFPTIRPVAGIEVESLGGEEVESGEA